MPVLPCTRQGVRWPASLASGAPADTRAYLASDRTGVWPERAISTGVLVPSPASWVKGLSAGAGAASRLRARQ